MQVLLLSEVRQSRRLGGLTPFFLGPVVVRVVLWSAVAGRETGLIMTSGRKRHTPEQVVRKLGQAD